MHPPTPMTQPETPEFTTTFRVRSYELDALGHVNHAVYLNYLEQARFDALSAGGFAVSEMAARNWGVFVVRIEVDYRKECRQGELLTVRTRVDRFRNSSMIIGQVVEAPDGETAVEARVVAVWTGPDGRPMRIPPEVRDALSSTDPPDSPSSPGPATRPDESGPPPS
jgi:thioesterase III